MMFGPLFLFALLGIGVWWFVQQQQFGSTRINPPQQSDPITIARMRYARGEITEQEFAEILETLQD